MSKEEYPKMVYKNGVPKHGEAEKLVQNKDFVIVSTKEQHDAILKEWGESPKKVAKKSEKKDTVEEPKKVEDNAEKAEKPRRGRKPRKQG